MCVDGEEQDDDRMETDDDEHDDNDDDEEEEIMSMLNYEWWLIIMDWEMPPKWQGWVSPRFSMTKLASIYPLSWFWQKYRTGTWGKLEQLNRKKCVHLGYTVATDASPPSSSHHQEYCSFFHKTVHTRSTTTILVVVLILFFFARSLGKWCSLTRMFSRGLNRQPDKLLFLVWWFLCNDFNDISDIILVIMRVWLINFYRYHYPPGVFVPYAHTSGNFWVDDGKSGFPNFGEDVTLPRTNSSPLKVWKSMIGRWGIYFGKPQIGRVVKLLGFIWQTSKPIGYMGLVYLLTFTIKIYQM